ncbi:MAG: hypothetical protein ACI81R_002219 [Bradymonadia bacterium]|jgi:hypothetical protein
MSGVGSDSGQTTSFPTSPHGDSCSKSSATRSSNWNRSALRSSLLKIGKPEGLLKRVSNVDVEAAKTLSRTTVQHHTVVEQEGNEVRDNPTEPKPGRRAEPFK